LVAQNNINAVKVFLAVKTRKAGKAAGCDEIQPEMLKALNRQGAVWLACVCQVACSGRAPNNWQIRVIIATDRKSRQERKHQLQGKNSPEPP